MRSTWYLSAIACLIFCGCASSKPQAKKTYDRPWIGGSFKRVATPTSVRTNAQHFAGHAMLLSRVREETPLAKAGLREGDVILAVNGQNVRSEKNFFKIVDRNGPSPLRLNIYRSGEISEQSVTPGLERFQKIHHITFGIGLATYMVFDLYPNPDFNLVALGYDTQRERLDVRSAGAKYRVEQGELNQTSKDGWQGLSSKEGWRAWLGPIAYSENKMIISQEAVPASQTNSP
jgi:membrane-associated protease RseP (regulator of RpoE activity)